MVAKTTKAGKELVVNSRVVLDFRLNGDRIGAKTVQA